MLQSTSLLRTLGRQIPATASRSSKLATTSSFRYFSTTRSSPAVGDSWVHSSIYYLLDAHWPVLVRSLPNIILPSSNPSLQITSLTPSAGYTLSDGLVLPSPVLMIDGVAFMWDVGPPVEDYKGGTWEGFEIEKLKVFEVVTPRPGQSERILLDCRRGDSRGWNEVLIKFSFFLFLISILPFLLLSPYDVKQRFYWLVRERLVCSLRQSSSNTSTR